MLALDVEIVGERQVLVDRLDAPIARIDRPGKVGWLALEEDLALVGW